MLSLFYFYFVSAVYVVNSLDGLEASPGNIFTVVIACLLFFLFLFFASIGTVDTGVESDFIFC